MKVIVCAKQVPDAAKVRLDPETNTLRRDGVPSIMNPYDCHALEAGVQLAEATGGTVTVITMGPPQAEEMLREAIARGAHRGVLLSDRAFAGADTWATAHTLAAGIRVLDGFDCILCGKQAIDGDTAQVGPGLAERLGIPYVTSVRALDFEEETQKIRAQRLTDDGCDTVEVGLPALFTVVREINTPRLPSLKGKMRAKKATITVLTAAELDVDPACLGLAGSPTRVVSVFAPPPRSGGRRLQGDPGQQVAELVDALQDIL